MSEIRNIQPKLGVGDRFVCNRRGTDVSYPHVVEVCSEDGNCLYAKQEWGGDSIHIDMSMVGFNDYPIKNIIKLPPIKLGWFKRLFY